MPWASAAIALFARNAGLLLRIDNLIDALIADCGLTLLFYSFCYFFWTIVLLYGRSTDTLESFLFYDFNGNYADSSFDCSEQTQLVYDSLC